MRDDWAGIAPRRYQIGDKKYALPEAPLVNWEEVAPCAGATHLFFPPLPEGPPKQRRAMQVEARALEAEAVEICRTCPYIPECRATYDALPEEFKAFGVWAGTTPEQRRLTAR